VLALSDRELLAVVGGRRRRELERRLSRARREPALRAARAAGLEVICRCDAGYPTRLRELHSPPACVYVAGGLERFLAAVADEPVAVVGARRASSYGLDIARSLGRGLAAAGLTVISGMALGVDSAAHEGAIAAAGPAAGTAPAAATGPAAAAGPAAATGPAVAVLPGSADNPYPPSRRRLYRQLVERGAAISELPPQTPVRRWGFVARNRIVAALSAATVVVEAAAGSGALITAAFARELGRTVGGVPGRVTTLQAEGTNGLLADGARIVRGPQDVLDALYGIGARTALTDHRPELTDETREVFGAVVAGSDTAEALAAAEIAPGRALAALAWLELSGYVRRQPGGRFAVIP
jgi:DNA processing protein